MATFVRHLVGIYYDLVDFLESKADPRVESLSLMSSPFPMLGIIFFYNYFVNKLGPQFMKSREPFSLKYFMIFYNIMQIALNSYIVFMCISIVYLQLGYSLICEEVDYSDKPVPRFIAETCWLYFIIKVLDLLDTVVMVLRKKEKQVSFLHVYHHSGMVIATWITTKYIAGGHVVFFGAVNTLVHAIMYFYYLLTVLKPEYKKSIWWKKHLTELQMVQFMLFIWHSSIATLNPYCNFPKFPMGMFIPQNIFMLFMFWDFYKKTYLKNKMENQDKVQNNNTEMNNNFENKKTIKKEL